MNTEQKLQKEIDRLTKALSQAQSLNAGLEKDKDRAWEMVQMMLMQAPKRRLVVEPITMHAYDRGRYTTLVSKEEVTGALILQLKEK